MILVEKKILYKIDLVAKQNTHLLYNK